MSTYLNAPYSGTIVDVNAHNGGNAMPGEQVLLLADLTTLQVVTTDMSEVDVVHVKVGNGVKVSFDSLPDVNVKRFPVYSLRWHDNALLPRCRRRVGLGKHKRMHHI